MKLYTTEEVQEKLKQGPPWWRRATMAIVNSLTWLTGWAVEVQGEIQCGLCGALVAPENAERHMESFHPEDAE